MAQKIWFTECVCVRSIGPKTILLAIPSISSYTIWCGTKKNSHTKIIPQISKKNHLCWTLTNKTLLYGKGEWIQDAQCNGNSQNLHDLTFIREEEANKQTKKTNSGSNSALFYAQTKPTQAIEVSRAHIVI